MDRIDGVWTGFSKISTDGPVVYVVLELEPDKCTSDLRIHARHWYW